MSSPATVPVEVGSGIVANVEGGIRGCEIGSGMFGRHPGGTESPALRHFIARFEPLGRARLLAMAAAASYHHDDRSRPTEEA